ncbi:MAG TPA: hypothetical protein VKX24_13015, partial [Acidimicrobiia bacterium]|nr:hypothetical protein [Acidimicrobiia bacterium]
EAKNGDKVVMLSKYGGGVGILYDAVPGNDHCNGRIAPIGPSDPYANLKECLHLDDAVEALARDGVGPPGLAGPGRGAAGERVDVAG